MKAAVYARISRDATAEGLGVERQVEDCRALAARRGWLVVGEFVDNDLSASTASNKPRPRYDALLESVRAGEVDVVVAYSNSRLTRRPAEWVDLIALANAGRLQITTVASGEHDLTTADGRAVAMTVAVWDAAEAERTSERLRRRWEADAASGKPRPGRYRSLGYSRSFEVIEAEAEVVREVFERKARGESLTSIARHLNAGGQVTVTGGAWSAANVGKLVSRPGYAGLREHRGQIVGRTCYPALVEEPLWRAANDQAARVSAGTNARKWLLSGLARCERCGAGMTGSSAKGYRCRPAPRGCGSTSIKADWIEDPVVSLVLAREAAQVPVQDPATPPVDLGPVDAQIKDVRDAFVAGEIDMADQIALLRDLKIKRRALEASAVKQAASEVWAGPVVEIQRWRTLSLSERRALIGRHLVAVQVGPRQTTGPGRYEPGRLRMHWHDGSVQRVTQDDLEAITRRVGDGPGSFWIIPKGVPGRTRVA